MKLTDRLPSLDAKALVMRFVAPPRFAAASFDTYRVDAKFSSQARAIETMGAYAVTGKPQTGRPLFRRKPHAQTKGLYLDGGFGVGKTHLLASLWHAFDGDKAYVTFTELTAFIGFLGMRNAVESFRRFGLICIDEFELDDIANTLMVVSFLRGLVDDRKNDGLKIAVTSNTLPDRLGEQRFSAHDFKREISAIAGYFDEIRIDGEDFRSAHASEMRDWSITAAWHHEAETVITVDEFSELQLHLKKVHPVQYGALMDGVSEVTINGLTSIDNQDDALLWVQFVDKLYDARIRVHLNGVSADDVFKTEYRNGGYRKKYGRAESRMGAMSYESSVGVID